MTGVMVVDYVGCFVVEKVLKYLYSDFRPKDIAVRRDDQLRVEEGRKEREMKEKLEMEEGGGKEEAVIGNGKA